MKYFSYDELGNGMQFFETAKEAEDCAQRAMDACYDLEIEDWPQFPEAICWGEIRAVAKVVPTVIDQQNYSDLVLAPVEDAK